MPIAALPFVLFTGFFLAMLACLGAGRRLGLIRVDGFDELLVQVRAAMN